MNISGRVMKSIAPKLVPFFKSVVVYLVLLPEQPSLFTAGVKCAPILSLVLFIMLHGASDRYQYKYSRSVVVGLLLSCLGDACLVWPQHLLPGMAAFGLAHCAYIVAFGFRPLRLALGAAIYLVTAVVTHALVGSSREPVARCVPAYAALLATCCWRGAARADHGLSGLASAVGGAAFVVSDGLIGVRMFSGEVAHSHVLIMTTYYLAQLCIALSVVDPAGEVPTDPCQNCDIIDKETIDNKQTIDKDETKDKKHTINNKVIENKDIDKCKGLPVDYKC